MLNRIVGFILLIGLLFGFTENSIAQDSDDELYIFGFSQVIFNNRNINIYVKPSTNVPTGLRINSYANSFALHQVNLFFQKNINDRTTFFLNLEASGSYSTKIPSGDLEIPEGWISFKLTDNLEIKTGLLLPKFNNLTEIKNRLPLFPYIIRPLMYESLLSNLIDPEDYKPKNAYFQLYGYNDISERWLIDYAFYIGNAEDPFLSSVPAGSIGSEEESTAVYQGENLNTQLLYGGRFGIENELLAFKFGASFTFDEDDRTQPESSLFRLPELTTPVMGEVPRYRLGFDLSFTYKKFAYEGEFMGAFHDHSEIKKVNAFKNANLNKYFHYSNLTYHIKDNLFLFGYYTLNSDNTYEFVANNTPSKAGVLALSGGSGWRINEVTVFKVQYLHSQARENDYVDYYLRFLTFGISTIF